MPALWTDFDADDHTTLCAYLVTRHGRATPPLWETTEKSALKLRRNAFEIKFLHANLANKPPPAPVAKPGGKYDRDDPYGSPW